MEIGDGVMGGLSSAPGLSVTEHTPAIPASLPAIEARMSGQVPSARLTGRSNVYTNRDR